MRRQWAIIGVFSAVIAVLALVAVFLVILLSGGTRAGSPQGVATSTVASETPVVSHTTNTPSEDAPPEITEDWIIGELQTFVDGYSSSETDTRAWIDGLGTRVDDGLKATLWTVNRDLTEASKGKVVNIVMIDDQFGQAAVHGDRYDYVVSFQVMLYEGESDSSGAWLAVSAIDYTKPPADVALPLPSPVLGGGSALAEQLQQAYSLTFAQSGGLKDAEREALIREAFVDPRRAVTIKRVAGEDVAIRVSPIDLKTVHFFDAGDGQLGAEVPFEYFPDGLADTQSEFGQVTVYLSRGDDGSWKLVDAEAADR